MKKEEFEKQSLESNFMIVEKCEKNPNKVVNKGGRQGNL